MQQQYEHLSKGRRYCLAGDLLVCFADVLHDDQDGQPGEAHGQLPPVKLIQVLNDTPDCAVHVYAAVCIKAQEVFDLQSPV